MSDCFGSGIQKLLLLGIGAAAATTEKSHEILDELVKKGELTVKQGKILNEELHHNISKMQQNENDAEKKSILDELDNLTPQEIQELKDRLAEMENTSSAKEQEEQDGSAK